MIFYTFLIVRKSCEKTKTTIDLILCATELHCCIKTIKTHRCTMAELRQFDVTERNFLITKALMCKPCC